MHFGFIGPKRWRGVLEVVVVQLFHLVLNCFERIHSESEITCTGMRVFFMGLLVEITVNSGHSPAERYFSSLPPTLSCQQKNIHLY